MARASGFWRESLAPKAAEEQVRSVLRAAASEKYVALRRIPKEPGKNATAGMASTASIYLQLASPILASAS